MKATEMLREEHDIILGVLDWAERECEHTRKTGAVSHEDMGKAISYLQNFADRCHQAKEEEILFAAMIEKGKSAARGEIAVMLAEHEAGRAQVQAAAEILPRVAAGDGQARQILVERLLAHIQLLRAHFAKEDGILYPLAESMFSEAEQQRLSGELAAFEKKLGKGFQETYQRLAADLASR